MGPFDYLVHRHANEFECYAVPCIQNQKKQKHLTHFPSCQLENR